MVWQDWVLSFATMMLGMSLIPTIRSDDKPALSTSILTTVFVFVIGTTMVTMELWLSAAMNYLIVLGWGTITLQKLRQIRRARIGLATYLEEEIVDGIQDGDEVKLAGSRRT